MTTAVSPPPYLGLGVGPLREATTLLALATAVLLAVAGATTGVLGVRAVLVAALLVAAFFVFGSVSTSLAAAYAPQTALLVALTTYVLQVALLPVAFLALRRSGAVPDQMHPGWLAGGVVVCTLAWVLGLVTHALRNVPGPHAAPQRQRTAGER